MPQSNYTSFEKFNLTFVDPHKYITFRYIGLFTLTAVTGVAIQQTMNLNSLFDPDRTGAGHQPYGYDQISALYNRYRVLSTKIHVVFGTGVGSVNVLVLPLNGLLATAITTQATFETAAENPRAINRVQGGQGGPSITISEVVHLNDLNGCTRVEYLGDDRFEAQIGASPTEVMTLNVAMLNLTVATATIPVTIEMDFMSDMHDPISLSGS